MSPIVRKRERVDDAAARKGQPRLALQPGNIIDDAVPERMCAASSEGGVEQACGVGRGDGAIGHPPRGRGDLDKGLQPVEPAGAGSHNLNTDVAG
jgi:hypothetical protein